VIRIYIGKALILKICSNIIYVIQQHFAVCKNMVGISPIPSTIVTIAKDSETSHLMIAFADWPLGAVSQRAWESGPNILGLAD